ncbi:MAG TPA: hypothetical protein VG269_27800 [Tepidisphaeraceae bacterium]|jgi:hypothetical protein|nr:hypothetical protein [Tepidisphaeraceae bacterium]
MMFKRAFVLAAALAASSVASAAVVFEPVQYQYRTVQTLHNPTPQYYYYGGSDPRVHEYVAKYYDCVQIGPNTPSHNFIGRVALTPIVYSDCAPYMNLSTYGYTATDAQNEANAGVPRYFRKRDLLNARVVLPDGSAVVPAQAEPIYIPEPRAAATTRPAATPILIIPKGMLKKPAPAAAEQKVVIAK